MLKQVQHDNGQVQHDNGQAQHNNQEQLITRNYKHYEKNHLPNSMRKYNKTKLISTNSPPYLKNNAYLCSFIEH